MKLTNGEEECAEPLRAESIEKIGLILAVINSPNKDGSWAMHLESSIMTRRDIVVPPRRGKVDEDPYLDSFITTNAGIGSRAVCVALDKIVDHACPKMLTRIENIMGNMEKFGDMFGKAYLATTSLLPFFRGRNGIILMFPYLEREAVDLITLSNQQCSCDGAVNSAAHSKKHGRMIHRAGILAGRVREELEVRGSHLISMAR